MTKVVERKVMRLYNEIETVRYSGDSPEHDKP